MSCDQIQARYNVNVAGISSTGTRIPGQNQIITSNTVWSLESVVYSGNWWYVGDRESSPDGLFFLNSTSYVICGSQYGRVMRYTMGTQWDITSSIWDANVFTSVDFYPEQVCFDSSGTIMFIAGSNDDTIKKYILSTAFSPSSASYHSSLSITSLEISVNSMALSPDGRRIFILGSATDTIYQYNLSTPFNLSTAGYSGYNLYVGSQETVPTGMAFKDDGTRVLVVGNANGGKVWQYSLSTPWDIQTGMYDNLFYDATAQAASPTEIFIGNNGSRMYIMDQALRRIYQYNL
jgi:hypothetical protein